MKKKVMFIDDEVNFLRLLKMNLESTGKFIVKTESKGSKGLQAVKEFKPDIIFLDIMMPDMDGGAVAQKIKEDMITKNIPIIFLTAVAKAGEVSSTGGFIGGNPFIAKPVDIETIINAIAKYT
ncbi:MAG: response regulator [Candidatus Omnitrophica bacterium]|nr:response regulator [Candidatus Omnitrophota bacterium]